MVLDFPDYWLVRVEIIIQMHYFSLTLQCDLLSYLISPLSKIVNVHVSCRVFFIYLFILEQDHFDLLLIFFK